MEENPTTLQEVRRLHSAVNVSSRICVFTGAGISCPSGIPDFRSANGLYKKKGENRYPYSPEEMLSHPLLLREPALFFDFYRKNMLYPDAKPNAAHRYFAELEKRGHAVTVVTQNVDGLHAAAGSTDVCELHGSVWRNYCVKCGRTFGLDAVMNCDGIPRCPHDNGMIRPDVTLYGESLDGPTLERTAEAVMQADLMIVVGTSLQVYPAASFVGEFRGNTLALINRDPTPYDGRADIVLNEDIIDVIRALEALDREPETPGQPG